MAVRIKGGVSIGYYGGFLRKVVPKIRMMMHGDTVRCTQNTFLRCLKGPILHFRPFKHADLRVVVHSVFKMLFKLCHQISSAKKNSRKEILLVLGSTYCWILSLGGFLWGISVYCVPLKGF